MRSNVRNLLSALMIGAIVSSSARAQEEAKPENLVKAEKAHAVLKTFCYRCHGVKYEAENLDVLDLKTLFAERKDDKPYVVAGSSADSLIYNRMAAKTMPPKSQPQPNDEQKKVIQDWIDAGAPPFPNVEKRAFKKIESMLTSIRDDLKNTPPADRKFQKYFTFSQMYNNAKISEAELRLGQAALAKLINSLSWKRELVLPEAADEAKTVFTIDVRRLGWEKNDLWKEVTKTYPYGLDYKTHEDQDVRALSEEIIEFAVDKLPWVRADWFISMASQPPLYHTLLELPQRSEELRGLLNVDVRSDFANNRLARAAFSTSGVSKQNRLVDRHFSIYGAYWESYDFKTNAGRGNLFQFPLGPEFAGNPFNDLAFQHDGGEIIFNLPNGLQGYMLVDNQGKRIDVGPTEVVFDSLDSAGKTAVVNGLSCMGCHVSGIKTFTDSLRKAGGLAQPALEKVQNIVPKKENMDKLVEKDTDRFMAALETAMAPFLQVGPDAAKSIRDFPEPIRAVSGLHFKDLGAEEVALELGLEDAADVPAMFKSNRVLKNAGLGALGSGGAIKRDIWSSLIPGRNPPANPFHISAEQQGQGGALIEQ